MPVKFCNVSVRVGIVVELDDGVGSHLSYRSKARQTDEVGNATTDCLSQVDTIALALVKIGDYIGAACTTVRVIHKNIRPRPAGQRVIAVPAIENVVATLTFEDIIAAVAGDDVAELRSAYVSYAADKRIGSNAGQIARRGPERGAGPSQRPRSPSRPPSHCRTPRAYCRCQ